MARRSRKVKQKAHVGWAEIAASICWMFQSIWRLVCLVSHLNPFRCYRKRRAVHNGKGFPVCSPSLWERFVTSIRSAQTNKRVLLEWAQEQIPTFQLNGFDSGWSDGVAFCALLESVCPGCCPRYDLLKPSNKVNNCRLGLKIAIRFLNIPQPIITAEEMASGLEVHEPMIHSLIQHVKWWSASNTRPVLEVDWFRANRPIRGPDGTILQTQEPCFAKGGGLVNGLVSKRCKFNIFTSETSNISIEIEIKGPNGELCNEGIKSEGSKSTGVEVHRWTSPGLRERMKRGQSLWTSLSNNIFTQGLGRKEGLVRQSRITADVVSRKKRIPLDYQTLKDNHFLISYVPISAGDYLITIKWHGEQIPGSPFSVHVAASVDLLQRKRTLPNTSIIQTQKDLPFKEAPTITGSSHTRNNPQHVTDAVLSHTSTILRPIANALTTKVPGRQLQKQATITRKRVLRHVVTRGGKEVIIHEAASSSSDEMFDIFQRRPEQLNAKSRRSVPLFGVSFDSFTDSANTSRPVSPQARGRIELENSGVSTGNAYQNLNKYDKDKARGKELEKPYSMSYNRSHSSDDIRFSPPANKPRNQDHQQPENAALEENGALRNERWSLDVPDHDVNCKRSPFLNKNVWVSESLDRADMREKLLEGGFITQMSPPPKEKIESDSTLDSDSDIVGQMGRETSSESSGRLTSSDNYVEQTYLSSKETRPRQKIKKQGVTPHQERLREPHRRLGRVEKCDAVAGNNSEAYWERGDKSKFEEECSLGIVKTALSKSNSDPCTRRQLVQMQRSKTICDSPPHGGGSDTPTMKILQSNSLRKKCIYISQKAINESLTLSPSKSYKDYNQSSKVHPNEEDPPVEIENFKPNVATDERQNNYQGFTGDVLSTGSSKPKIATMKHKSLHQSLSLPALSKNWKAFEIDSDDEVGTFEQVEAMTSAKRKRQRATLGAVDLHNQLKELSQIQKAKLSESCKQSPNFSEQRLSIRTMAGLDQSDKALQSELTSPIPVAFCGATSSGNEKSCNCQTTEVTQAITLKGPLHKQDKYNSSSSESNSLSDIRNEVQENEESDKENNLPRVNIFETVKMKQPGNNNENTRSENKDTLKPTRKKYTQSEKNKQAVKTNRVQRGKQLIVKIDRSTQVSYAEIKEDTGWKAMHHKLPKMKNNFPKSPISEVEEDMFLGNNKDLEFNVSTCNQGQHTEISNRTVLSDNQNSCRPAGDRPQSFSFNSKNFNAAGSAENQYAILSPEANGRANDCESNARYNSAGKIKANGKPVRQSTIDTVDSGIVDELSQQGRNGPASRCMSRPRYVLGHQVVARRPNKRFVPLDPKVLFSSVTSSEDNYKGSGRAVRQGQEKVSIAGLVNAVQMFSRKRSSFESKGRSGRGRSKICQHRKRVLFSRKTMTTHRSVGRFSFKCSRSRESLKSHQSIEKKLRSPQTCSIEDKGKHLKVLSGVNNHDKAWENEDKTLRKIKFEQKQNDVKKWINESSPNPEKISDKEENKGSFNHTADLAQNRKDSPAFKSDDISSDAAKDPPDFVKSTDDPNYCSVGVSANLRQGLLDELNLFSQITSPDGHMSRQDSLAVGEDEYINESWESPTPQAEIQDPLGMEIQKSLQSPRRHPQEEERFEELRSFLLKALPSSFSPADELEIENVSEVDSIRSNAPNAMACRAIGVGLTEGTVGAKNNFQVSTYDAGNGTLTVGINGPRPHTVTETNITYTGDNMYDVMYDITQPGYYAITIKWSDISIKGSPFVCKVSY